MKQSKRVLSVFSLVMINVIAIDSLRNLPINAEYGYAIVFFYLIGALFFFIPCALITAELATQWPKRGGAYVWIKEAFGERWAFFSIWLEWIYNVVWFPTILSFIGASIATLINPHLVNDRFYMVGVILICFLLATWFNCRGMRVSSLVSEAGAVLGTFLPMLILIVLAFCWAHKHAGFLGQVRFLPNVTDWHNISFLIAVLFSLMGIEMSSVHAEEVKTPRRDYPKALLISCLLIVTTLILSSLAVAVAVPYGKLNMIDGLNQAFQVFFTAYHVRFLLPVIELLIILGAFAGMAAWVIGPTKALMVAANDGSLPKALAKTNRHQAPKNILLLQAGIVILLSLLFLFLPSVKSAYWLLSALTSQLALVYYAFLFACAWRLKQKYPVRDDKAFQIPFGKLGLGIVVCAGLLSCVVGLIIGFVPPGTGFSAGTFSYELLLICGIVIFALPPLVIYRCVKGLPRHNNIR